MSKKSKGGAPPPAGTPTQNDTPRARQKRFLDAFAACGTVTRASELAGNHRDSHYRWHAEDADYPALFAASESKFADGIRDFVKRRAIDGVPEPIIWQGVVVKDKKGEPVTVLKRSDRILELLAKAKCPEFKDKIEHSGPNGAPVDVNIIVKYADDAK